MIGIKMDNAQVMAATSQTLKRLGQLTNFSQRQVLIGFAGVVLKRWAGLTKISTQAKTDRNSRLRAVKHFGLSGGGAEKARGDVTVNAGFRKDKLPFGMVWIKVHNKHGKKNWILAKGPKFSNPTGSATFTWYKRKMSGTSAKWMARVDKATSDVSGAVPGYISRGRRSVGLSRQSVVQIADALGIDLTRVVGGGTISAQAIGAAKAALASTNKFHRNGTGAQGGTSTHDWVDLINTLPYARKIGMDRTLLGVLAGQAKYFERSYAKGAFDTQAKAVRAYPNLFRFSTSQT